MNLTVNALVYSDIEVSFIEDFTNDAIGIFGKIPFLIKLITLIALMVPFIPFHLFID